jgi:hypothetical protein
MFLSLYGLPNFIVFDRPPNSIVVFGGHPNVIAVFDPPTFIIVYDPSNFIIVFGGCPNFIIVFARSY